MEKISLKVGLVADLAALVDGLTPKDLVNMKGIRLCSKLTKSLREVAKDLISKSEAINDERDEIIESYRKRFETESAALKNEDGGEATEAQKKTLSDTLAEEMNKEIQAKLNDKVKEYNEQGKTVTEFELSLDEYKKLKEWFANFLVVKYTNKETCVEVADALKVE